MVSAEIDTITSKFFAIGRKLKHKASSGPLQELTVAQMEALRFLAEKNGASMKDLSVFLAITPPSATVLIDRLVRLQLVSRQRDPKSRRNVHLQLTKKGAAIMNKSLKEYCRRMKTLLQSLTSHEQLTMLHLLHKMTQSQ